MSELKPENLKPELKSGKPAAEANPETTPEPEQLANERCLQMQNELTGLQKEGTDRLGSANNFADITAEDFERLKSVSKIDSKISLISARAKNFLESAIKKMTLVAMTTMALSGAGEFEKANASSNDPEKGTRHIENPQQVDYAAESERQLHEKYQKATRAVADVEKMLQRGEYKSKREKKALENYKNSWQKIADMTRKIEQNAIRKKITNDPKYSSEKIRFEIAKHISSPEYLKKLQVELGGDLKKAEAMQKERVDYVNSLKIYLDKEDNINERVKHPLLPNNISMHIPKWLSKMGISTGIKGIDEVAGFYNTAWHEAVIPDSKDDETAAHEILHGSTLGTLGVTEKAADLLKHSYKKLDSKEDAYYKIPAERLVRKQLLDLEMNTLGIKNYGEKFTKKHYEKLKRYYKKGFLTPSANQFMKTTKPEYKYFEEIFNGIAENDTETPATNLPA